VYHVTVIIVLINMLIAMMSHSFEDIQVMLHLYNYTQVTLIRSTRGVTCITAADNITM